MEAMIVLSEGWIYYKPHSCTKTAKDALTEFRNATEHIGMNIDNITITKVVLRDDAGNDINTLIINN